MPYPTAAQELLLRVFFSFLANALIKREIHFLDDHGSHCFVVYKCDWGCVCLLLAPSFPNDVSLSYSLFWLIRKRVLGTRNLRAKGP